MLRRCYFPSLVLGVGLCVLLASSRVFSQNVFDVPVRINMGGPELVDSRGRTWLGDGPGAGDPLDIRPDDLGGTNTVVNWCAAEPVSLEALGFDPLDPNDASIFSTIRWDLGADGVDFRIEIPIPDGDYLVNLFFQECCCEARHFRIEIEGEIVDEDVSFLDYGNEDVGVFAGLGVHGRLSFEDIEVEDGVLDLALLPCPDPDCPGSTDINAIIDAIEVVSGTECDGSGLDFRCEFDPESSAVVGNWAGLESAEAYRILKNGEVLVTLPEDATSFEDPEASGAVEYTLEALDGDVVFAECRCSTSAFACTSNLICEVPDRSTEVAIQWTLAGGIDVSGYELYRNDELISELGPGESVFEDEPGVRSAIYRLVTVTDPPGQCEDLTCDVSISALPFAIPVRINMGGDTAVDSLGRTWIGDRPCNLEANSDTLALRPDDFGGTNAICNWCPGNAESFAKYGLDATHPGDAHIFTTIRWDNGTDGLEDFFVEIPIDADEVLVNLYFNECCCSFRHFKISLQGQIANADVSYEDYDEAPALGKLGRLSFPGIDTSEGFLRIGFLPCPDCPGATDRNAIINAIEILDSDCECDAEDPERRCPELCPTGLSCTLEGGTVEGSWSAPSCKSVTGFELRKNGELLRTLDSEATSFSDDVDGRTTVYEVTPVMAEGEDPCGAMTCTVIDPDFIFDIPVRINMGGPTRTDSLGRVWIGDGPGAGDPLEIRPDDAGGAQTVVDWCVATSQSVADSLQSFGLDPFNPSDQNIFNTIRWDIGDQDQDGFGGEREDPDGGEVDFRLEIPIPDGEYNIACYFTECCCPDRHFQVFMESDLVAEDVSAAAYSASGDLGRTGRLVFEGIVVEDGALSVGLFPCGPLDCPDNLNYDSLIDAIEILPTDAPILRCPHDLICTRDGEDVLGQWSAGEGVTVTGYTVYRNGEEIATLPANATEFRDDGNCSRVAAYEVVPMSDDPEFLCPDLRLSCTVVNPDCSFSLPVRINMGGDQALDSQGNLWFGDRPCSRPAAEDPLGIRPIPDLGFVGGNQAICNWCAPDAASYEKLGFDVDHPGDRHIFSTIRWDVGGDGAEDFIVEIPIDISVLEDDFVDVHLYFNECGATTTRHFKVSIQDEIVDDDVSSADYDEVPGAGKLGRLSFPGIDVSDEVIRIGFFPCPECPGVADVNAIINAIEILPSGKVVDREICNNEIDDDEDGDIDCDDSDCAKSALCPGDGPGFLRGDTDGNGQILLNDAIQIFSWLFQGGAEPGCVAAADTSGQGDVNLTSGVYDLNFLFTGGPPPPAPYPECGVSTDPDDLRLGCNEPHCP